MALLPLLGLGPALALAAPTAAPQPHVLHIIADDYGASPWSSQPECFGG